MVFERTLKGGQQLVCLQIYTHYSEYCFACYMIGVHSCFHFHKSWLDHGAYHVVKTQLQVY